MKKPITYKHLRQLIGRGAAEVVAGEESGGKNFIIFYDRRTNEERRATATLAQFNRYAGQMNPDREEYTCSHCASNTGCECHSANLKKPGYENPKALDYPNFAEVQSELAASEDTEITEDGSPRYF